MRVWHGVPCVSGKPPWDIDDASQRFVKSSAAVLRFARSCMKLQLAPSNLVLLILLIREAVPR